MRLQLEGAWIDRMALGLIALTSLLYAHFGSNFAEIHLKLPFLDFPIFIGEILLAACLALFVMRWRQGGIVLTPWQNLFLIFWGLVVVRALWDYALWGPLSFRNAALFYYLIFAFFGYTFYQRRYFTQKVIVFSACFFIFLASGKVDISYFWFSCYILSMRSHPQVLLPSYHEKIHGACLP